MSEHFVAYGEPGSRLEDNTMREAMNYYTNMQNIIAGAAFVDKGLMYLMHIIEVQQKELIETRGKLALARASGGRLKDKVEELQETVTALTVEPSAKAAASAIKRLRDERKKHINTNRSLLGLRLKCERLQQGTASAIQEATAEVASVASNATAKHDALLEAYQGLEKTVKELTSDKVELEAKVGHQKEEIDRLHKVQGGGYDHLVKNYENLKEQKREEAERRKAMNSYYLELWEKNQEVVDVLEKWCKVDGVLPDHWAAWLSDHRGFKITNLPEYRAM